MHDGMLLTSLVWSLWTNPSRTVGIALVSLVFVLTMIWPMNYVTTSTKQFGIRSGWSLTGICQWLNVSDLSLVTAQSVSQFVSTDLGVPHWTERVQDTAGRAEDAVSSITYFFPSPFLIFMLFSWWVNYLVNMVPSPYPSLNLIHTHTFYRPISYHVPSFRWNALQTHSHNTCTRTWNPPLPSQYVLCPSLCLLSHFCNICVYSSILIKSNKREHSFACS